MNAHAATGNRELRQNWRLLLAAVVGSGLSMTSLPFFTIGIFAPIFARQFGWAFSQIMGGLLIVSIVALLLGPFIGVILDRFGSRRIATLSLVLLGLSYMTLAAGDGSLTRYYASWVAIAVLGIGATVISFTHAVSTVFVERRGTALGIALAGSGFSTALVKPIANALIVGLGWKVAILVLGALPLLVAAPLAWWGLPRDGATAPRGDAPAKPAMTGLPLRQALRARSFWTLLVAFGVIAVANGAPLPNMEKILAKLSLTHGQTVGLTALIGAGMVVGRLVGGWLIDRLFAPLIGALLMIGAAAGCLLLSVPGVQFGGILAGVILISLAAGVEYDLLAFLVARYIGLRSYGRVYGIMFGVYAIGAGGGPMLLGHSFDSLGSYGPGLRLCAAGLVLAAATCLTLGRYPELPAAE